MKVLMTTLAMVLGFSHFAHANATLEHAAAVVHERVAGQLIYIDGMNSNHYATIHFDDVQLTVDNVQMIKLINVVCELSKHWETAGVGRSFYCIAK